MNPNVSVVIPVYNAQSTLEQCLDSVLRQAVCLEAICVDDGSTDQSLDIMRRFAQQDARVKVLTQKNQYAGVARNRGMAAAKGKYLAFLDADDYFLSGVLGRLYTLAESHELDLVKGGFLSVNQENGRISRSPEGVNGSIHPWERRRLLRFAQRPWQLLYVADVPWNGLYRRAFLERNNIQFNHLICVNDHSFYIHCLIHAERMMVTNEPVTCYRVSQAASLIGRKADHFDAQLTSFVIIRGLSREAPSEDLARTIMQHELNSLFGWYQRLRPTSREPQRLDALLSEFLRGFDETEVGEAFLRSCPYWTVYWTLRYGTPAPARKPPDPFHRVWRCWREHGLYYMWTQLKK